MPALIPDTLPGFWPADTAPDSSGTRIRRPPCDDWPLACIRLGDGAPGASYAAVPQPTVA